jgi:trans-2,3-dihydro-3-hydroxyanthranilate isomerase
VSDFLDGLSTGSYVLLDCFTDSPLSGNQLAVFLPRAEPVEAAVMQRVARELNLSETVFLEPPRAGGDALARIFTPLAELPFAGHPVLGTAVVQGFAERSERVALETGAGIIPVALDWSGSAPFGQMEQPLPNWEPYDRTAELLAALHIKRSLLPVETYSNGPLFVIVVLESAAALAALAPDPAALSRLGLGVYCTAALEDAWEVRMFAPAFGIVEDPATGSGAGLLAAHLARHGAIEFGEWIEIRQGLRIARPSLLRARASGSAERIERVEVGGSAVIVGRGEFRLA